ncbi:MAG TPA: hypothetical protein VMF50_06430 [Candidatus Binataceae bacterium]|nr:hypothetical protein [Candidatus Binataceae bacterium]
MATLIDVPEFTLNEVYAMQQTDPVEGAAAGASFSGIGISNQPHQQLANRTAFLKQRQDTNINNIGVLQAFQAAFTSLMEPNGYLITAALDVNRGAINPMLQWGQYGSPLPPNSSYSFNFPNTFANACEIVLAVSFNPAINQGYGQCTLEVVSWSKSGAVVNVDIIGNSSGSQSGIPGFVWVALGF